jgi:tripartite-type tricarboxylate transporter receptor subunit TctC
MMNRFKTLLMLPLTLLGLMALPQVALAQYPNKPIKMIIGYTAGGAADKLIRPIAERVSKIIGQPFIMEYRPGAGAAIALDITAKADPDGYTLHITDSGPMVILPNMRKLAYDPLKDFTNIAMIAGGGTVIVVRPDSAAKDIKGLIALAKKDPAKWSYGTSGIGGVGHLAGEQLNKLESLNITHVPYKGGNPAVVEVLGGHVPFLFSSLGAAATQIEAGALKPLAVTSLKRSIMLPNVPTLDESGYKGFDAAIWFSIVGPKALPTEVMTKLVPAFNEVMKDPALIKSIQADGYDMMPMTPAQMDTLVIKDLAKWGRIIKEANVHDQ